MKVHKLSEERPVYNSQIVIYSYEKKIFYEGKVIYPSLLYTGEKKYRDDYFYVIYMGKGHEDKYEPSEKDRYCYVNEFIND